jgi:hypothetical protein
MTIELNDYGFMFDMGDFIYLSLSWAFIILTALSIIAYKIYKRIRNKKVVENYSLDNATNELWAN